MAEFVAEIPRVSHITSLESKRAEDAYFDSRIVKKTDEVGQKRLQDVDPFAPPPLTAVPITPLPSWNSLSPVAKEGIALVDKLNEACGAPHYKSAARLLLEANARMTKSVEGIVLAKKRRDRKKKADIETNVHTQADIINSQGWWKMGGTATTILPFLGLFVAPQSQEAFSFLARFGSDAATAMSTFKDAPRTELSHEQSIYTQTISGEKQALEGFKRLPDEVRNLILELARLERQVWESLSRVGG